jgi:hypothetical protein
MFSGAVPQPWIVAAAEAKTLQAEEAGLGSTSQNVFPPIVKPPLTTVPRFDILGAQLKLNGLVSKQPWA